MKNKILSFAFCFAIISTSFGQRRQYLGVKSYGNSYTRLAADSVLHIPLKTSNTIDDHDSTSPQIFVRASDSALVYVVGSTFKLASSGIGSSFSGSYLDLTNKPAVFSGSYTDLANKPALFNGAYSSLTGAPTIPTIAAGTNTSVTYSGGVYTISSTASGSGGGSYVAPTTYTFTSTGSSTITLPYAYVSGSVNVTENGVPQVNSFSQTSSTVITLNYVPFSGTTFVITYTKQ